MFNYDKKEKATWLRETTTANGIKISTSERSGIVKVEVPGTGMRAPKLYVDEILAILAAGIELQRYLEANHDICFTQGQAKESGQVKRNQVKAAGQLAQVLENVDPKVLEQLLKAKLAKQA